MDTFFCDTAVLVAGADRRHVHHAASLAVVRTARKDTAFCSAHTIAELHAVLTSSAYQGRLRDADVSDLVTQVERTFTVVGLTASDYFATIRDALARDIHGGSIYDALHLAAAMKADATRIYTWNVKHFRALAPGHLVDRIQSPTLPSTPWGEGNPGGGADPNA